MSDEAGIVTRSLSGDPIRPSTGPIAVGATLGRYHLRERIGAGGMGVVFAAHDPALDRIVAVKVLRPQGTAGEARRLEREGRVMAKLSHRNVIQVYDVGIAHGTVFVAMEYVRGGTLRTWLDTPRTPAEILAVFTDVARGLAAAHDAGFVHRDVKPSNVLIGDDGRVLVTDFGLARAAAEGVAVAEAEEELRGGLLLETVTRAGTLIGTPAYMAPEQHRDGFVDPRADQFSYCVALWDALFGARPFAGATWSELAAAAAAGRLEEPPPGDVPPHVRAALARGLSADPAARFPTMHALVDALGATPRTRRRWTLLVALIALAALGGVALAVRRSGGAHPAAVARGPDAAARVATVDAGVPDAGATVIAEAPAEHDAPPRHGSGRRDVGVRAPIDAGVPDDRLTARGTVAIQIFTSPADGIIYLDGSYRGPSGVTVEEAPFTARRVKCTLPGHGPGFADLVFDGTVTSATCRLVLPPRCVDGLQNPFDECPDP